MISLRGWPWLINLQVPALVTFDTPTIAIWDRVERNYLDEMISMVYEFEMF